MHATSETTKRLERLRGYAASVDSNFTMAVAFHEVWKPTAFDNELHERMGKSYASQAFLIVRAALRREMLLALMRIWDKTKNAHSLCKIVTALQTPDTWSAMIDDRTIKLQMRSVAEDTSAHLSAERREVLRMYKKYSHGGSHYKIYERLKNLRNVNLAHTQAQPSAARADPTDDEVNEFYKDSAIVSKKVMSIYNAEAVDYSNTSDVYSHYAKLFWINARGEKTEGHPNYRRSKSAA